MVFILVKVKEQTVNKVAQRRPSHTCRVHERVANTKQRHTNRSLRDVRMSQEARKDRNEH